MVYSIIPKSQLEEAHRLDAEYYQPEYLELTNILIKRGARPLNELAEDIICGPFGSEILQTDYRGKGTPLIRVGDVSECFIKDDELVFIDEALSEKLKRYQVMPGDLAVSQRGTIAMFSMVTPRFSKWNISANLISIKKSDKINFNYLLAFLNSSHGTSQLLRRLSGQVQPKITTGDVKQILVFIPSNDKQEEIANLIRRARRKQENSKLLYSQAENLLLEELRLKNFKIEDDLSYVVNLSEVKSSHRTDAEYFQPKYDKLMSKIKSKNAKLLGNLVSIKKGVEPGSGAYQEEGKLFIRVSSLSKYGITKQDQKYLSEELYQNLRKDFESKVGEILLTKDATPGITCVLKEPVEGIIAGGILRLKLRTKIEPEYLTLVLNSLVGQMQAEKDTGGSVIIHWRPDQIKNCLIPVLPKPTQQKISKLVQQSFKLHKESKTLIEKATKKVELLVASKKRS